MKYLLFLFALLLFSCTGGDDPYQEEQKAIDKELASIPMSPYKAFKVAVRGTAATGKDPAFDQARQTMLTTLAYTLTTPDSARHVDLQSVVNVAESIDVLSKKDEDELPTILQNIDYAIASTFPTSKITIADLLNESEEHALLGGIWLTTPGAPSSLTLYELSRVHDDSLRTPDLRLISKASQAIYYYQSDWPYHSEKVSGEFIALTEKEKNYLLQHPWPAVDANGKMVSAEQSWHQLHGMGYLLRAVARMKMEDKDDETVADFEAFVADMEAGGYDAELTWIAGAYVAIKKDDKEKAIAYLGKLENSKMLTDAERNAVKSTKEYVEQNDKDKAFSSLRDKIAIVRIASAYFGERLMASPTVAKLQSTESGQRFLNITKVDFSLVSGSSDSLDSLGKKAKSLLDKVGI